ncbi:MAG TPA: hypothetical protein VFB38_05265 [Chthonomonadaceae bacterium]|nr:hypothetical protein [Chthonomonadaceae bacterium]
MSKPIVRLAAGAPLGCAVVGALTRADNIQKDLRTGWTWDFSAENSDLVATGRNPYFSLEPGSVAVLEDGDMHLTITVTDQTKVVDGVVCRVVEDKESKGGKVSEVSHNYFALSRRTNSI